jgi:pectate lyase
MLGVVAFVIASACGSGGSADGSGGAGTGGRTGTGGATGSGGPSGSGGVIGSGGVNATASGGHGAGGATGSGGVNAKATGGSQGSGGTSGSGGTASSGGAKGTGGSGGPAQGGAGPGGHAGGGASGTGGAAGSGGTSSGGAGGCAAPPMSPLVGWASVSGSGVGTTTGGGSASPTLVTSLAELNAAAAGTNAAVIWVKGTITGVIRIGSNKTIAGVCGGALHGHVEVNGATNVIFSNLTIVGYGVGDCALDPDYDAAVGCSSGNDAITVQKNAHHIWIDHCDISDGTDGNLDITNAANYVTVSWTKFHYTPRSDNQGSDSTGASGHRFSNLVGGSDSATGDAGNLNVTWHHDWWADNVVERQPRVRFGKNHLFNDLWSSSASSYCVRAGVQAQILVESSVFTGAKNPTQFNNSDDQTSAYITQKDNVFTNTSGNTATGGGGTPFTTPPYGYTPDATTGLEAAIRAGAGPH